jgi:hypothetical protein
MSDDQFFAILTSKRDEGLAHIQGIIERSGIDEFCKFLTCNVMPVIADNGESELHGNVAQLLISHMAMVGAVDALLAHRDNMSA